MFPIQLPHKVKIIERAVCHPPSLETKKILQTAMLVSKRQSHHQYSGQGPVLLHLPIQMNIGEEFRMLE
jgi:hypothetical protein